MSWWLIPRYRRQVESRPLALLHQGPWNFHYYQTFEMSLLNQTMINHLNEHLDLRRSPCENGVRGEGKVINKKKSRVQTTSYTEKK